MAVLFVHPDGSPVPVLAWEVSGAFAMVGFTFMGFEFWRRRGRLYLVLDGDLVVLYRHGRPARAIPREAMKEEKPDVLLLFKVGLALGAFGAALLVFGILSAINHWDLWGELALLALGSACWTSLGFALWAGCFCTRLRLPARGAWRAGRLVLVDPSRWRDLNMGKAG